MAKKVFVSGIFDLLHSGHVAFFKQASAYGDLYVSVASDQTFFELKAHAPVNNETERLYMVRSVASVKDAFIARGSGLLDFLDEFKALKPDIFIVTEEANIPEKEKLCAEMGVEYIVIQRDPEPGLVARSSTALRSLNRMPYRVDVAGGWLDQPFVSQKYPGAVITVSIEPTIEFNERSGMASSTRRKAIELWGTRLPAGNSELMAKILFCFDNPPGTKEISGSQDAIGIVCPGANKSWYDGNYWPKSIESIQDSAVMAFVEQSMYLIPLGLRHAGYSVLSNTDITAEKARRLSEATDRTWEAMKARDRVAFGRSVRDSFEAQISMFPNMMNSLIEEMIAKYCSSALGWKISGAGGGGYLILVSEKPIENAVRVHVRNRDECA
jgi:cytidyltransferase-like protein